MFMCQFGPFISKRAESLQTDRRNSPGVCVCVCVWRRCFFIFNAKGCMCLCVTEIKRMQQHAQWGKTTLTEAARGL